MYVWVGIDVDSQLQKIKSKTRKLEQDIGFLHSNLTLPLHISLKMPFEIDASDLPSIISAICDFV